MHFRIGVSYPATSLSLLIDQMIDQIEASGQQVGSQQAARILTEAFLFRAQYEILHLVLLAGVRLVELRPQLRIRPLQQRKIGIAYCGQLEAGVADLAIR